jgi:hypothetical protein
MLFLYAEKEGCEDLIYSQILTAFLFSLYVMYLLSDFYKASYTVGTIVVSKNNSVLKMAWKLKRPERDLT